MAGSPPDLPAEPVAGVPAEPVAGVRAEPAARGYEGDGQLSVVPYFDRHDIRLSQDEPASDGATFAASLGWLVGVGAALGGALLRRPVEAERAD